MALYNHNLRNKDTDYKSGDGLNVDYSLGWGLGHGHHPFRYWLIQSTMARDWKRSAIERSRLAKGRY